MSDRTKVTYIRISNRLEATRSPVDGQWRAHALVDVPFPYELNGEPKVAVERRWATLGVGRKAKDAIDEAEQRLAVGF